MFKKLVLMCGLVFIALPLNNVFAAEVKLSLGNDFVNSGSTLNLSGKNFEHAFDSNTAIDKKSFVSLTSNNGDNISLKFVEPRTITSFSNIATGTNSARLDLRFNFYNSSGDLLLSHTGRSYSGAQLYDVDRVVITNPQYSIALVYDISFYGSGEINYNEISNLSVQFENKRNVLLSWKNPINSYFVGTKLYRNGDLLASLDKSIASYKDENLAYSSSNEYRIVSVYNDGFETNGVVKNVEIDSEPRAAKDILELKAQAKYNEVSLSWVKPKDEKLKHVNIYRDKSETEEMQVESLKKIFETNGTTFKDFTVEPETSYQYKLTTTSTDDLESEGVEKTVKTPAEPPPVIKDGTVEEEPNGDYKFTWSEPTNGMVRILVGGKEYATVKAAEKQIIIPKRDMKYTRLGDPDIQAIPISESGLEGGATRPPAGITDMELPFGAGDLIKTGSGLLWWIAPFVLLGLSFLIVPKLRKLIVNAVKGKKKDDLPETERRTKTEGNEIKNKGSDRPIREPREMKVRERQLMVAENIRERTLREPRLIRSNRTPREPKHFSTRVREPREGRQSEREPRIPRELRKGR